MKIFFVIMTSFLSFGNAALASNSCNLYIEELTLAGTHTSGHGENRAQQLQEFKSDIERKGYHVVTTKADAGIILESFGKECAGEAETIPRVCNYAITKIKFKNHVTGEVGEFSSVSEGTNMFLFRIPASIASSYSKTLEQIPDCSKKDDKGLVNDSSRSFPKEKDDSAVNDGNTSKSSAREK